MYILTTGRELFRRYPSQHLEIWSPETFNPSRLAPVFPIKTLYCLKAESVVVASFSHMSLTKLECLGLAEIRLLKISSIRTCWLLISC